MTLRNLISAIVICFASLNFPCDKAYSVTATKIQDILDHPRDFENKEITVHGTVTNSVSLLVIKYFEIRDKTGSIKVVTDKLLPSRDEKLTVTGRMMVVEIGPERWVVLREDNDSSGRQVKSNPPGGTEYFKE